MREIEHLAARTAPTVVKQVLGQNTNERRLAGIDISNHCDADIVFIARGVHVVLESLQILRLSDFLDLFRSFIVYYVVFVFGLLTKSAYGLFEFRKFRELLSLLLGLHLLVTVWFFLLILIYELNSFQC